MSEAAAAAAPVVDIQRVAEQRIAVATQWQLMWWRFRKHKLAVRMADPHKLAARFNGHRLRFLTDLKTWPTFGRGWARRVADNLLGA